MKVGNGIFVIDDDDQKTADDDVELLGVDMSPRHSKRRKIEQVTIDDDEEAAVGVSNPFQVTAAAPSIFSVLKPKSGMAPFSLHLPSDLTHLLALAESFSSPKKSPKGPPKRQNASIEAEDIVLSYSSDSRRFSVIFRPHPASLSDAAATVESVQKYAPPTIGSGTGSAPAPVAFGSAASMVLDTPTWRKYINYFTPVTFAVQNAALVNTRSVQSDVGRFYPPRPRQSDATLPNQRSQYGNNTSWSSNTAGSDEPSRSEEANGAPILPDLPHVANLV